jgi:hypothetical protein
MSTKAVDNANSKPYGRMAAFEFRSRDWVDPFPHHVWSEITYADLVAEMKTKLDGCSTYWRLPDGHELRYEISYHPELRPMLVCIWGIQ